jgi:hypothetical protein
MRINLPEWGKSYLGTSYIDLDAQIIRDAGKKGATFGPFLAGARGYPTSQTYRIEADTRSTLGLFFDLSFFASDNLSFPGVVPKFKKGELSRYTFYWDVITTGKGELKLSPPRTPGQARATDTPMSVNVDILDSKDDPTAKSPYLRVTLQLSLPDDGNGQFSVQVGEAPVVGGYTYGVPAQGGRTVVIPLLVNFIVDLPAPREPTRGIFKEHTVFFNIDSANIGENVKQPNGKIGDQGELLDEWVEGLKSKSPDVYEALVMGFLPLRGEAHASKTLKGKKKDDPEVRDYNQKKSEERMAAVVLRLKSHFSQKLDTSLIRAKGITGATTEDEDVNERRCQVRIEGSDLDRGLAKLKQFKAAGADTP